MNFTVREALSDADWSNGCELLQKVYVSGGYPVAESAVQFMVRDRLEGEGEFLLAVRTDGVVIGAVLFLHEQSALRQLAQTGEREFRVLAVHPGARGCGVGEALVQACIDRALLANAGGVVIWTQPTMLAAHRLYERLGFLRALDRDQRDPRGFTRLVYAWRS
ncbi:MAG: GNAT family N-acetyltransferase [Flavobacteriales bacterium]|nr:GNAT family N-acetyltransferase [Flavobacteriales bacterium]